MSRDISTFPEPITLASDEEGSFVFRANSISFGVNNLGNLISHGSSSFTALTNLVLKILLTTKGSVPSKPQEGTNLNNLLRNGYNPNTINEDVALILLDTENQIKQLQLTNSESDLKSKLASLNLSDLSLIANSQLTLTIMITNQLDQSLAVQVS